MIDLTYATGSASSGWPKIDPSSGFQGDEDNVDLSKPEIISLLDAKTGEILDW